MTVRNIPPSSLYISNSPTSTTAGVLPIIKTGFLSSKAEDLLITTDELSDSCSSEDSLSESGSVTTFEPTARTVPTLVRTKTTKALCVIAKRTYGIANDIPYPSINTPDEVIIRTQAVGLNPIDWKSVDYNFCMPSFPWIGGREVAGIVEEVGANVTSLKVGDRVWASTYYRDRRAGTFQEFCVVPQHTVLPLPSTLSTESGACLGVAALTAAMTLWKWLKVPMPTHEPTTTITAAPASPKHILVWGGSAVTGQFVVQLAHQSGLSVIAITSRKTAPLVSGLGAARVLARDGKTNDALVAEIRAITGDDLVLAVDIVGNTTGACCLQALSTTKAGVLAPLAFLRDGQAVPRNVTIAPVEMKRFIIEQGNRVYAEELNRLITLGALVMPEIEVLDGGLEAVEAGLEMLKSGDMNGRKLVVKI